MNRHLHFLSSLIVCSLFSGSVWGISSAGTAYVGFENPTNHIYSINLQTGAYALIPNLCGPGGGYQDMGLVSKTNSYVLNSSDANVYSFNLQTEACQLVTTTPIPDDYPYAMAVASNSTAYVIGINTNNVYSINLQTGQPTFLMTVPGVSGPPSLYDIAIGNNSKAYVVGIADNNVYELDLVMGTNRLVTTTPVGFPGTPNLSGIALADNSTAYVIGIGDGNLYSVNLNNGTSSLVTANPISPDIEYLVISGNTAYTNNGPTGNQVFAINLQSGTSSVLTTLPETLASGFMWGIGIFPQIGTGGLSGNNLKFANYLNKNAPIDTNRLFFLLTDSQLPEALMAAAPTRNAFATFASQNGYLATSQVVADHGRQRRMHQRQRTIEAIAMANIPSDELLTDASDTFSMGDNGFGDAQPAYVGAFSPKRECQKTTCLNQEPYTAWGSLFGEYAHEKSQRETPAFDAGLGGVIAGFDFNGLEKHAVGVGGAYVYTHIDEKRGMGSANVQQGLLTVYGTLNASNWYFDLGLWGGYYHIDNSRKISFPFFKATARSDTNGWQLAPHFEVGYDAIWLNCCGVEWFGLEPFLMADWVANWEKGFKEHGAGLLNMGQKGRFASLVRGETGLRIHETAIFDWGRMIFTEKVSYAYQKAFHTGTITAFLVGSPGTFAVTTLASAQNLGVAEFSMLFVFTNSHAPYVDLRYQGEFGSKYQSHQLVLEIGKDF